ncbi:MAG TPA: Hsp20/alpha crystallin family protein [Chloroflexi bacterium]|nr:Hsp20/alpha crystallin family protein [Chloroflexota bacterium]
MYRTIQTPTIWREMDRLQRDMNRLITRYYPSRTQTAPDYPAINIWANRETHFVSAEIPGVRAEDIDLNVEGNTLTISGERYKDEIPENANCHRQERGFGKFSRSITLPSAVEADKVEATFKNGLLNITLPKLEAEKPKKIEIRS